MSASDEDYYDSDEFASDDYNSIDDNVDDCDDDNEIIESYKGIEKYYTVLNEADIRKRQVDDIDTISSLLFITKESACVLLQYYRWSTIKVQDAWFSDEEKVCKSVRLSLNKPLVTYKGNNSILCRICFEKKDIENFSSTACGHMFCDHCWKQYAVTSINDGPGCLTLRCPNPKCLIAVPQDMIDRLVSDEHKNKYFRFLVASYIEGNPEMKWCPAPGCSYAVEYDFKCDRYDVTCKCLYRFCWNCTEEDHRPVNCDTVAKWVTKCKAESESMKWILAYTKPCPKCKKSIEKNKGCMHMTCTCKYEFCWLCLGSWTDHKDFYACNRYEKDKKEGKKDDEERTRKNAKNAVVRYLHYYERWSANDSSRKKALEDLNRTENESLEKMSETLGVPVTELKFVTEAWVQIVECRRVLKWTYAYGYYIPDMEGGKENFKKKFFEYLQGQAEAGLERLHHCVEKELSDYLEADERLDGFDDFRVKLLGLTSVTATYFENLVNALENDLSEMLSRKCCIKTTKEENGLVYA